MSLAVDMRREAVPPVSADVRPVPRISIHAFCETADFASVMQEAAADRRMARARIQIENGGLAAAAGFYHSAATPNLIIVESKLPRLSLEAALDQLSEVCDAGTKVIVVGHVNDVA